MVNNGTVASRIEATDESTVCSPQLIRKKGAAKFVILIIIKGIYSLKSCGILTFCITTTIAPNKNLNPT